MQPKVLFLMDANNIEMCIKNGYKSGIVTPPLFLDYHKLAHDLSSRHGGELLKSYYFTSLVDPKKIKEAKNQKQFLYNLEKDTRTINKIAVVRKPLLDGKEKGVDVGIAVKMIDYASATDEFKKIDRIILFSADSDFVDALELVRDRFCKQVEVVMFSWCRSYYLEARFPTFILRPNLTRKFARK